MEFSESSLFFKFALLVNTCYSVLNMTRNLNWFRDSEFLNSWILGLRFCIDGFDLIFILFEIFDLVEQFFLCYLSLLLQLFLGISGWTIINNFLGGGWLISGTLRLLHRLVWLDLTNGLGWELGGSRSQGIGVGILDNWGFSSDWLSI